MEKTGNPLWVVLNDTDIDALGLTAKGAALAQKRGLIFSAVLVKVELTEEDRDRLSASGAESILHLPIDTQTCGCETWVRDALASLARERKPAAILFLSSLFFCAVAPAVAAALKTGITADCTKLEWDDEGYLFQSRPTFGGRMLATIRTRTLPAMATVRRGVFPFQAADHPGMGRTKTIPVSIGSGVVRLLEEVEKRESPQNLRRAELIFAGGRGMDSKENFKRLYELAARTGGQVAASRGAVAAGFAPFACQVGQTGLTVRPRFYVAFGISGAVQHLSGMIDSECIVAVNPDRGAPIHQVSDYSIYADAGQVISGLLDALDQKH